MLAFAKKYQFLWLFVYISLWTMLASTPLDEVFHFPKLAAQIFSLLLYVPFLLLILWKILTDLKGFRLHFTNVLFYLFGIFYAALTVLRFLNAMEVKESLYYSVVLFGCFAIYLQIYDGKLQICPDHLEKNLLAIGLYVVGLKLLFTFLEGGVLSLPPINNLYSTSVLVMLLPVMVIGLGKKPAKKTVVYLVCFSLSLALILTCSSRAIVMLAGAVLLVLFLTSLPKPVALVRIVAGVAAAALLVSLLATCNIGWVRRSVYRGTGFVWPTVTSHTQGEISFDSIDFDQQMQQATDSQIDRSDEMRETLMQHGLAEFMKNPVFGTGDLYYTYDLGYKTMEQTAHNFILEALICYGIAGTLLLIAMLCGMLIQCGFFRLKNLRDPKNLICLLLVMFHYFALGMVQPSVFNTLLCPLFALLLAFYGLQMYPPSDRRPVKEISLLRSGKEPQNDPEK